MDIRIIKGPLPLEQLQVIAGLYGRVDAKYASMEYCSYLFNDNPFGYSYHAFAFDEDLAVGHISLIPMWIDTPEGEIESFKAEAFYLKEEYRDSWICIENDELPLGLAMPKVLYDAVLNSGTKVIHLLADEEIGRIHQYAGCIPIDIKVTEEFLILDPQLFTARESSLLRQLAIKGVSAYQRLVSWLFCGVKKRQVHVCKSLCSGADIMGDSRVQASQWTISMANGFNEWLLASPFVQVYSADNKACCVVKQSEYPLRHTEILSCYCQEGAIDQLNAIIQKIVIGAKSRGASTIILKRFASRSFPDSLTKILRKAGFLHKQSQLTCFVRSPNKYFLDSQNLAYTQFFYTQF